MRISQAQISQIKHIIHEAFGNNVDVWLFGSRLDDHKKGGDIDLYVEPKDSNWFDAKIKVVRQLEMLFPYPVDVVVKEDGKNLAIYQIAKSQGVKL